MCSKTFRLELLVPEDAKDTLFQTQTVKIYVQFQAKRAQKPQTVITLGITWLHVITFG